MRRAADLRRCAPRRRTVSPHRTRLPRTRGVVLVERNRWFLGLGVPWGAYEAPRYARTGLVPADWACLAFRGAGGLRAPSNARFDEHSPALCASRPGRAGHGQRGPPTRGPQGKSARSADHSSKRPRAPQTCRHRRISPFASINSTARTIPLRAACGPWRYRRLILAHRLQAVAATGCPMAAAHCDGGQALSRSLPGATTAQHCWSIEPLQPTATDSLARPTLLDLVLSAPSTCRPRGVGRLDAAELLMRWFCPLPWSVSACGSTYCAGRRVQDHDAFARRARFPTPVAGFRWCPCADWSSPTRCCRAFAARSLHDRRDPPRKSRRAPCTTRDGPAPGCRRHRTTCRDGLQEGWNWPRPRPAGRADVVTPR